MKTYMSYFPDPRPASWFDPPDPWIGATCFDCGDEPVNEDSDSFDGDYTCASCTKGRLDDGQERDK